MRFRDRVRERLGKELGGVVKEPGGRVNVCVVYPNLYRLGMGNLGFQSACRLFNSSPMALAERAFLPDPEYIEELRRTSGALFSYESLRPLNGFDVIALSVSFEEDFFNIPRILELSGLSPLASERAPGDPLVMAGGAAISLNPEPIADFIDIFLIGEGEGAITGLVDAFVSAGGGAGRLDRERAIEAAGKLDFIYVPSKYSFTFDGPVVSGVVAKEGARQKVGFSRNPDLGRFELPQSFITTPEAEFGGAYLIEIERGCPRGCRFCAAGFMYLPPRWRDSSVVAAAIEEGMEAAGKVGLVGAAVSEYPHMKEILESPGARKGEVTLSSLRVDCLDAGFLERLRGAGYRTVTLAPEAGSQRLRDVINKCVSDEEILSTAGLITGAGFAKVKLYFMVGLPTETDEDAAAIADLALRIKERMGRGSLALSINPFIPKPLTPFQWHPFEGVDVLERRMGIIKKALRKAPGVTVKAMPPGEALIQAYLSRGDRRAGRFIMDASGSTPKRAAKNIMGELIDAVSRERTRGEALPWDVIEHGITKDYLWKEYQRGLEGRTTPPCDVGRCTRCGVC